MTSLPACEAASTRDEIAGAPVRDSADVVIVEHSGRLPEPRGLEHVPRLRIEGEGSERPDAARPLHQVTDVAGLDGPRQYAVLNAGNATLELYHADGTLAWVRGARGEGPGDFDFPMNVRIGSGDTIWVYDPPLQRITAFDRDGGLAHTAGLQPSEAVGQHLFLGLTADGGALTYGGQSVLYDGRPLTAELRWEMSSVVQRDRSGGVVREVLRLPSVQVALLENEGRWQPTGDPLFQRRLMAMAHGVIAVAFSGTFEIFYHDLDGALRRIVRMEAAPEPLSRDDRLRLESRFAQIPSRQLPGHYAVIEDLIFSREGELWVREASRVQDAPRVWSVFDPEGHLLDRLLLPDGFGLLKVEGAEVIGVVEDSLGRQSIAVLRR